MTDIHSLTEFQKTMIFSLFWGSIWTVAFYGHARLTGWHHLAQFYKAHQKPDHFSLRFKTILLRFRLSYEFATALQATETGFYLAVFFLFRPGHPCLFIPWNEITIHSTEELSVLKYIVITTKKAPQIRIRIPKRTYEKMVENLSIPLFKSV